MYCIKVSSGSDGRKCVFKPEIKSAVKMRVKDYKTRNKLRLECVPVDDNRDTCLSFSVCKWMCVCVSVWTT